MISQDNRLMPVTGLDRSIDRPLADLAQSKPYGVTADSATFRDYLFVVLKRKWLILSLVLVVTSLVTIQAFRSPSIYEGETTIRIEQRRQNVLQTKELVITGQNDPNFWGTQLKLLENPALARQVVGAVRLVQLGGGGVERQARLSHQLSSSRMRGSIHISRRSEMSVPMTVRMPATRKMATAATAGRASGMMIRA